MNQRLPNFVIIGAPKSGTTSLFYYLKQHPDIFLPVRKELHYFSYGLLAENAKGPGDANTLKSLCATKEQYREHYAGAKNQKAVGEASPSYLYYSEVAEKIHAELDAPKIIAILRNPVEKAFSQYSHLIRDQRENLIFFEALKAENERRRAGWSDFWRYAESSLYSERIGRYLSLFGKEKVKVLLFDDLVSDPDSVMTRLFEFLEVRDDVRCNTGTVYNPSGDSKSKLISNFFTKPNTLKNWAKRIIPESMRIRMRLRILSLNTKKKRQIDDKSRKYLLEYFRKDILALEELLDRKTNWLDD